MGLLVAAAVAFVVASSAKPKLAPRPATAGGVLPPGERWEPPHWEPAGDTPRAPMRAVEGAAWAEGQAFIESAKSVIGVLEKYPVAGGESCIGEMSLLVRRLQPLVGRGDAAARTERALLERRMEAAWARAKDTALPLSA